MLRRLVLFIVGYLVLATVGILYIAVGIAYHPPYIPYAIGMILFVLSIPTYLILSFKKLNKYHKAHEH